jgi:hypothetical protein
MKATHIYVAVHENGVTAACVDDPRFSRHTAKWVTARIREGASVERVTADEARARFGATR